MNVSICLTESDMNIFNFSTVDLAMNALKFTAVTASKPRHFPILKFKEIKESKQYWADPKIFRYQAAIGCAHSVVWASIAALLAAGYDKSNETYENWKKHKSLAKNSSDIYPKVQIGKYIFLLQIILILQIEASN